MLEVIAYGAMIFRVGATLGAIILLYLLINGYKGCFGQNWAPNDPNRDPNDVNGPTKGQKWTKIIALINPKEPQFFFPNFEFGVEPSMLLPLQGTRVGSYPASQ